MGHVIGTCPHCGEQIVDYGRGEGDEPYGCPVSLWERITELEAMVEDLTEQLDSAEQELRVARRFIPLYERWPDLDVPVEVTVAVKRTGARHVTIAERVAYRNGTAWWHWATGGIMLPTLQVLAWRPLPEPWEGEDAESV